MPQIECSARALETWIIHVQERLESAGDSVGGGVGEGLAVRVVHLELHTVRHPSAYVDL